jgi:hypothetical protein
MAAPSNAFTTSRTVRRHRHHRRPHVSDVEPPGGLRGTLIPLSWLCRCFRIPVTLLPDVSTVYRIVLSSCDQP